MYPQGHPQLHWQMQRQIHIFCHLLGHLQLLFKVNNKVHLQVQPQCTLKCNLKCTFLKHLYVDYLMHPQVHLQVYSQVHPSLHCQVDHQLQNQMHLFFHILKWNLRCTFISNIECFLNLLNRFLHSFYTIKCTTIYSSAIQLQPLVYHLISTSNAGVPSDKRSWTLSTALTCLYLSAPSISTSFLPPHCPSSVAFKVNFKVPLQVQY